MAPKKEERRRGKKRKSTVAEEPAPFFIDHDGQQHDGQQSGQAGQGDDTMPSWLTEKAAAGPSSSFAQIEAQAPFGLVEVELKAYLRTAHLKLQELMDTAVDEGRAVVQDDEVKVLRNAMLDEIKDKERMLATDMDTSLILEDMLSSFSERQTRILADALTVEGSVFKLCSHRFASHLLQSTLIALQSAVSQEITLGESTKRVVSGEGQVLRSAQELILDISTELQPHVASMLSDQFGTHVLRTLLLVLSGQSSTDRSSMGRSKKSRAFHQKHQTAHAKENLLVKPVAPHAFRTLLEGILNNLKETLTVEKAKALAMDTIAGPTLTLVIELTLSEGAEADVSDGTLLDAVLDGLVTKKAPLERSPYVEDLMKDSVGSHLLERALQLVNEQVVARFWAVYVKGRLAKLGTHPIANFVIATLLRRLGEDGEDGEDGEEDEDPFAQACKEVELAGDGLIKNQRMGVLIGLADRAHALSQLHPVQALPLNGLKKRKVKSVWTDNAVQSLAGRAILSAFGFRQEAEAEDTEEAHLIKVLVSGKTRKGYRKDLKRADEAGRKGRKTANEALEEENQAGGEETLLFSMQGSLLCQSLLRLREPANAPLLESMLSMASLVPLTGNPTTVHVVLAPLQPESDCTFAQRAALSAKILSELPLLLSDKFGSRVIDSLFLRSDAFYKQKIMLRCIESEKAVLSSNYGRYFLKRTNMSLFRKDVAQWKRWIKENEAAVMAASTLPLAQEQQSSSTRPMHQAKKRRVDDELDTILAGL